MRNETFDLSYVGAENTTDETAAAIVHLHVRKGCNVAPLLRARIGEVKGVGEELQTIKCKKFANFPLTRATSLLVCESREKAGPVPSAESVFFSGSTSQFFAVDDC